MNDIVETGRTKLRSLDWVARRMRDSLTALGRTSFGRWLRTRLVYERHLKRAFRRQLGWAGPVPKAPERGLRVFAPMIETSHYRYYHYLALTKALQLRGADVKLLLCGAELDGCELKSVKTLGENPCINCQVNHRHVVPHFGIESAMLADYINPTCRAEIEQEARDLSEKLPAINYTSRCRPGDDRRRLGNPILFRGSAG